MQPAMFQAPGAAQFYAPQQLLLNQGDRVEVKWEIQDDDSEETYVKWWGATVMGVIPTKRDPQGRMVFQLRYDPDPDQGFDNADLSEVSFLDAHRLFELGTQEIQLWRRQGSNWDA